MLKGKIALAYTAGIIDGEGYVGIVVSHQASSGRKNPLYYVAVDVSSTDEWLPQWLKMQYGGTVHCNKPKKQQHKPLWRWYVSHSRASKLLQLILPYLQLKRQQAELAIAFQNRKTERSILRGRTLTSSDIVYAEAQAILVRKLNEKGHLNIGGTA